MLCVSIDWDGAGQRAYLADGFFRISSSSSSLGCRHYQGVLDAFYSLAPEKLREISLQTLLNETETKLQQAERSEKKLQNYIERVSSKQAKQCQYGSGYQVVQGERRAYSNGHSSYGFPSKKHDPA